MGICDSNPKKKTRRGSKRQKKKKVKTTLSIVISDSEDLFNDLLNHKEQKILPISESNSNNIIPRSSKSLYHIYLQPTKKSVNSSFRSAVK